jgi:hypothetical protein
MRDNINQIGMAQLGCWLVGEFGEMLINGQAREEDDNVLRLTPEEIIDTYVDMLDENDRKGKRSDVIISWALTALSKLTIRLPKVQSKIKDLIDDMHKKTAYFLVTNFDEVLIPTISSFQNWDILFHEWFGYLMYKLTGKI